LDGTLPSTDVEVCSNENAEFLFAPEDREGRGGTFEEKEKRGIRGVVDIPFCGVGSEGPRQNSFRQKKKKAFVVVKKTGQKKGGHL